MTTAACRIRRGLLSACCVTVLMAGCGGGAEDKWSEKRPKTYPVKGTVLYNGQPVAGASVSFRSESGQAATGMTDDNGGFELRTFESGDGAIAGKHKVTVVKSEVVGEDPSYFDPESPNYGKEPPPEAQGETKYHVPQKYGSFETSGLTAEIKESGDNVVRLELSDSDSETPAKKE